MSVRTRMFGWKDSCCTGNRRTPAHTPPTPQSATCANTSEHAPREPSCRADKNPERALRSAHQKPRGGLYAPSPKRSGASATWSPPKHCQINPGAEEVGDDPVFGRLD